MSQNALLGTLGGWVRIAAVAIGIMAMPDTVTATPSAGLATFNVRDYGAAGNGSANDTAAINRAISAASAASGGGIVLFPAGTYKSSNTIHMKSHVTLQLDAGSTILGSGDDDYDPPEPNPYDAYQDYGHSHFHNAMIYGDRLTNIGFVGTGTIDGGGHLITGNPDSGEADKIISLTRCNGLTVNGIRLRRGGHFAMLTNNCNNITSDHLRIDTASDRDGWNVISATNVRITNADFAANDDALGFKSDYALGAKLPNGNVVVTDSRFSAVCCNALMFGSETCGDFSDYRFERITIVGGSKSGLGMVSMDGAVITDVHYRDIKMTGSKSHIMQKVGTRRRCGNNPGVGRISNITYDNITGEYTGSGAFSPTLWGESGSSQISDVTFTNVNLTVPGGSGAISTAVPTNDPKNYNPNSIGPRPSYGFYLHNARNITFNGTQVHFVSNDNRPAILANAGSSLKFDRLTAERGSGSSFDVGFQSIAGYCVANSQNTSGGPLRISASGSTQNCTPVTPVNVFAEAEAGTVSSPLQVLTDANASGGQYVAVAAGNNSQASAPASGHTSIAFSLPSAGTYKFWGRVIAPTPSDDSFWFRVDGGPWVNWNDISPGSAWHWAPVTDDANSNAVVLRDLAAGAHIVTFAYREDGTRLDRVLVTNDLAMVPMSDSP